MYEITIKQTVKYNRNDNTDPREEERQVIILSYVTTSLANAIKVIEQMEASSAEKNEKINNG